MKDPIKDLVDRAAKRGMTLTQLFIESNLSRQMGIHWMSKTPKMLIKYLRMLDEQELEVDLDRTTFEQLGDRAFVVFAFEGFKRKDVIAVWAQRDSNVVQTYKTLLKTLRYYETNNLTFKRRGPGRPVGSKAKQTS